MLWTRTITTLLMAAVAVSNAALTASAFATNNDTTSSSSRARRTTTTTTEIHRSTAADAETPTNGQSEETGLFLTTDFVDERSKFEERSKTNPNLAPEKLLRRAKEVLSPQVGLGTKDGGACLAENFEFCAAVVGPIGREEYLNALGTFKLEDAFTIEQNIYGMAVDPIQSNRVWYFTRVQGKHDKGPFMGVDASGKDIVYPPQVHHIDFDDDGDKIVEFGFYTADRRQGNTGGLGGAFGFMYGVGKPLPIPECQPYKPSKRFRFLQFIGSLSRRFSSKGKQT